MKKIILIGKQSAGKTTLCQRMLGQSLAYNKTQAIEILGDSFIDTPGEYLEQRTLYRALLVTSVEADVVLLVMDGGEENSMFAPSFSTMFTRPVIGVITKQDMTTENQIKNAKAFLAMAGADPIFITSSVTGYGFDQLMDYLTEKNTNDG